MNPWVQSPLRYGRCIADVHRTSCTPSSALILLGYRTIVLIICVTKRLKIEYTTNNNEYRNYTFEPYELFIVNQLWYVGGLNEKGQIRSLKLSRMHACVLVEDETFRFDEPTSKSIRVDNYGFKINPQKVKVEIKDNTYFKEFIWGENQKITPIDESKYILEVEFLNVLSAKSFILEGGHHFKVLEPENLKQWVKKEAEKILENYA